MGTESSEEHSHVHEWLQDCSDAGNSLCEIWVQNLGICESGKGDVSGELSARGGHASGGLSYTPD